MCLICNVAGSVSIFSAKPVGSQALLLPVILAYCIGDILALIFVYSFFFIPVFFLLSNKIVFEWFFSLSSFKWKQTNERLCVQTNTTLKEIMSHTKSCSILFFLWGFSCTTALYIIENICIKCTQTYVISYSSLSKSNA